MATIYLSLSEKSDTNPQREIRIRFKHGKIDQQAMTNIFIPLEYWDETTQQIIVPNFRLMNDEKGTQTVSYRPKRKTKHVYDHYSREAKPLPDTGILMKT